MDPLAHFQSHNQTSGLPGDADVGGAGDADEERRRAGCGDVYAALHGLLSLPDWSVSRAELFVSLPSLPSFCEMKSNAPISVRRPSNLVCPSFGPRKRGEMHRSLPESWKRVLMPSGRKRR